jgi:hypothetical protein
MAHHISTRTNMQIYKDFSFNTLKVMDALQIPTVSGETLKDTGVCGEIVFNEEKKYLAVRGKEDWKQIPMRPMPQKAAPSAPLEFNRTFDDANKVMSVEGIEDSDGFVKNIFNLLTMARSAKMKKIRIKGLTGQAIELLKLMLRNNKNKVIDADWFEIIL